MEGSFKLVLKIIENLGMQRLEVEKMSDNSQTSMTLPRYRNQNFDYIIRLFLQYYANHKNLNFM